MKDRGGNNKQKGDAEEEPVVEASIEPKVGYKHTISARWASPGPINTYHAL